MTKVPTRFKKPRFRPTFIRQWRKFRGLTLERLAARVEMSPGNLSNIETGKQGYTQGNLEFLADRLGCAVVDLLVRDPTDAKAIWSIWEQATPAQRDQIVAHAEIIVKQAG